jgi:hypothetical protein
MHPKFRDTSRGGCRLVDLNLNGKNNVTVNFEEIAYEDGAWIELAQGDVVWQAFVSTVRV